MESNENWLSQENKDGVQLEKCEQRVIADSLAILTYVLVQKRGEKFRAPCQGDINLKRDCYEEFSHYTNITSLNRINAAVKLLVECFCLEKYNDLYGERHRNYVLTKSFRQHLRGMSGVVIVDEDGVKDLFEKKDKEVLYSQLLILLKKKLGAVVYQKQVPVKKKGVIEKLQEKNNKLTEQNYEFRLENKRLFMENVRLRKDIEEVNKLVNEVKREIGSLKMVNRKLDTEKMELLKENRELNSQLDLQVNAIEIGKHREIVLALEDENKKKEWEIAALKTKIRTMGAKGNKNVAFDDWGVVEDPEEYLMKNWPTGKKAK